MLTILIVEDDLALNRLMKTVLTQSGYRVLCANNGQQALDEMEHQVADLIISDVMMPEMSGFELLEQVRAAGMDVPFLLVTARDDISDKGEGFRLGADDYMVKPIDIKELVMRAQALLRRAKKASEGQLQVGDTHLDCATLTITRNGQSEALPQKEFFLLFKLLASPGRIFTRMELMDEIWGLDSESDEKTVNVHVSKLRTHFADCPDFSIETIRGLGYKAVVHHE